MAGERRKFYDVSRQEEVYYPIPEEPQDSAKNHEALIRRLVNEVKSCPAYRELERQKFFGKVEILLTLSLEGGRLVRLTKTETSLEP